MNRTTKPLAVAVVAAIAALATVAAAEDVWTKANATPVRAGKGALYKEVASAAKGTKLTVLAREGKWLKVGFTDKAGKAVEGWVFEDAISATRVGGDLAGALAGRTDTSDPAASAAGRGLSERAEQYASAKNMDPRVIDNLIALRNSITPEEWERFTAEGKVGPHAVAAAK